ncbi:MAG: DUF3098 domain-containing protein [Bacteroidales bacterium]|nr:DUF3098 domain-containing protein [Bacteroidales bacterium]
MAVKKQINKEPEVQPKNFALSKINFIIMGVAVLIIIIGFVLMTGPSTTLEGGFEPDIFSARRIKVAPLTCFIGFMIMIVGILYPDKNRKQSKEA